MPVSGHPGEYVPVEEEGEGGHKLKLGGASAAVSHKAAKANVVRVSAEEAKMRASAIAAIVRRMTVALAQDGGEISQLSDRVATLDRYGAKMHTWDLTSKPRADADVPIFWRWDGTQSCSRRRSLI